MPDVVLRRVLNADLDPCLTLERACFPEAEAASRENIAVRIRDFPQGFLVAEAAGAVVGHVNSGATGKDDITDEAFKALIGHDPAGRNAVVFSLAVAPAMRGRGLGARLMRAFALDMRAQGRERVLLLCKTPLAPFYARLGFEDRGPSVSTHGGAAWREMALALDGPGQISRP